MRHLSIAVIALAVLMGAGIADAQCFAPVWGGPVFLPPPPPPMPVMVPVYAPYGPVVLPPPPMRMPSAPVFWGGPRPLPMLPCPPRHPHHPGVTLVFGR